MVAPSYPFGAPTLNDLMLALTSAGTIEDVAAVTLRIGAVVVGADAAHLSVVMQPGWRRDFAGPGASPELEPIVSTDRPIALDTPLSRAMASQREQVWESREQYRATFPHLAGELESIDANAAITLPMRRSDGTVIGALTFGFEEAGPIPAVRRSLARQVSEQCGLALERSLLLHREREAARRALRLQGVATRLAGVQHARELAIVLDEACNEALGSTACAAYLLEPDNTLVRVAAPDRATSAGDTTLPDVVAPDRTSPVRDAVALGHLVGVESEAQFRAGYGDTDWPITPSMFAAPLRVGSTTLGAFCATFDAARRFTPDERSFANALAEQISIAVERIRLNERAETQTTLAERERDRLMAITSSLQDGLFTTDTRGRVVDVNERFCEIAGFTREQVIGAMPPYPWWPGSAMESVEQFLTALANRVRRSNREVNEFDVTFQQPDGRRVLGLLTVAPLRGADGQLVGAVGTIKDITARVLAERRLRALQTVTANLAAAATIDDVARAVVDEAVPALRAASGAFYVRREGERWVQLVHQLDVQGSQTASWRRFDIDADTDVAEAMRTGRIVVTDTNAPPSRRETLHVEGPSRAVRVPVHSRESGEVVACISLVFRDDRPTPEDDLTLYTAIAQQCGQAIERALASEAEHQARLAAERSNERTRRLQRVTAALTIASEPLEVAHALREHATKMFGSDGLELFAVAPEAGEVVLIDDRPIAERAASGRIVRAPLDADYAFCEAVRTQQPVWVHDEDEWAVRFPTGHRDFVGDYKAVVVLPLVVDQRALGALAMVFRERLTMDDDDRAMLTTLADLAAHALHRADRYATERAVASTLQQSLLPAGVQGTDRCAVAVRYQPALDELQVGGDWYDTVLLSDGRLAITVGDVVGRGLPAAASMGQLRSALAAIALQGGGPAEVLERVDGFARRTEGGESATVAFALFDSDAGTLHYACAGHPPPLLIEPGASPRFLEGGRSWPIGVDHRGRRRREASVRLNPGSTVVFYTDGLVERRKISLDDRLASLAALASALPPDDPGAVCDGLLDGMLADAPSDDVAVLAMLYDPALAPHLRWTFPADPANVPRARHLVRRWLRREGLGDDVEHDVVLAVDEACSNAIDHGCASPGCEVELDLHIDGSGSVVATISDGGTWRQPVAGNPTGHGLVLMHALMSSVEVERGPRGTRVRMTRSVHRRGDLHVAPPSATVS